jgi:Antirestriction protein
VVWRQARLLLSRGEAGLLEFPTYHAVRAVNGIADARGLNGRLRPLTACAAACAEGLGQSRPKSIVEDFVMNMSIDAESQVITALQVSQERRIHTLPKHFGRHMLQVEHTAYGFMRELANQYAGGYWQYFELSNGGFYMAPQAEEGFDIKVDGNDFAGRLSADAAGITVCLFTYSHLSFQIHDERLSDHYHTLREYAYGHREATLIFAAID